MPELELLNALMLISAYLLGSVPSAILVCHCMGIDDPRQQGSRNPGASNVLRIGNRRAALLTLLGDGGKGWCAVSLPGWFGLGAETAAWCALAAIIGHIYPLFTRFQGGKGVATAMGIYLALAPLLGVLLLLIWAGIIAAGRIASLASVSCALLSPLLAWLISPELLTPVLLISLLLVTTHRENLRKLVQGNESRF